MAAESCCLSINHMSVRFTCTYLLFTLANFLHAHTIHNIKDISKFECIYLASKSGKKSASKLLLFERNIVFNEP